MNFYRACVMAAAIVSVAASAGAQAAAPQRVAETADPARQQVLMFEVGLRNAVEIGGAKFADRVAKAYPGVTLSPGDAPVVKGLVLREVGVYMFTVEVPEFLQTSLQIFNWMRERPRPVPAQPIGSRPGMASATGGVVTADPMAVSPVVGDFDPSREYTSEVMAAIIDTMIENSRVLPLDANQTLVIVATGRTDQMPAGLYRSGARDRILSIKASDLVEYRNGAITREEVARRIKETRF